MSSRTDQVGLWLIGATGSVAATVAVGIAALAKGQAKTVGLVTQLPPFRGCGLVEPGGIVLGGHEIRTDSLAAAVHQLHERSGLFDEVLLKTCADRLRRTQRNIRPGTLYGAGKTIRRLAADSPAPQDRTPATAIDRLADDITAFRRAHSLRQVVVINVASSEPQVAPAAAHTSYARLQRCLNRAGTHVVPTSAIYALAAIEAGCAYVNFTPSPGLSLPAVRERAEVLQVPYMGNDGKTGETLVKSVLAPMFAMRNLNVLSWVGQNILGNRDGKVLEDPKTRASKIRTKDQTVARIVGGKPATHVGIDFVESLDDWKVAWDFIHFEGFLGTKMNMQFTWQGSDSALAAPLVIDLARLAAREMENQRAGPMRHLACFFKDPVGVDEYDLPSQWRQLTDHVTAGA